MLGWGLLYISSMEASGADDYGMGLLGVSFVADLGREPESDLMRMSWSDPRVTAMEERLRLLEQNQIQQDVVMQSQDDRMQAQADEIVKLRKIADAQKILLVVKIDQVQTSLGNMFTKKTAEMHERLLGLETGIRKAQNSLVLQKGRINKLSKNAALASSLQSKLTFGSVAKKKPSKKKK